MLLLLLGCPHFMWTKKGRPMRRITVIALLVLPVVALITVLRQTWKSSAGFRFTVAPSIRQLISIVVFGGSGTLGPPNVR